MPATKIQRCMQTDRHKIMYPVCAPKNRNPYETYWLCLDKNGDEEIIPESDLLKEKNLQPIPEMTDKNTKGFQKNGLYAVYCTKSAYSVICTRCHRRLSVKRIQMAENVHPCQRLEIEAGMRIKIIEIESEAKPSKDNRHMWNCRLPDGKHITADNRSIARYASSTKKHTIQNDYDLTKPYGTVSANGKTSLFDIEEFDRIKQYEWSEHKNDMQTRMTIAGKKQDIRMCETIIGAKEGLIVDHKTHGVYKHTDTFDNRKQNLRYATYSQNSMNTRRKAGQTGHIGVHKRKNGSIVAVIKKNGKVRSKWFHGEDAIEKACEWRSIMEEKLFGEFAFSRFNQS